MNSYRLSIVAKNVFLVFAFLVLQSCDSQKYNFAISQVVPAAEGSVEVRQDDNNNYEIDLEVTRLAGPERLSPAKKLYIVWVQTEKNGDKNIGQLKTASGFLSKTLKSSLKTVTSFKPTGFLISAENDAGVLHPGEQVVLRTAME
ncbi:hypothetical protein [Dyadobacter psychrotolerans]|uniref:Uncharacterized protein n=1 Tax=Dyadobacter psychrotolerans TaxID=2541721 RepID=A0A4R5DUB1_9BACT|nr:hypothetical protein [Dyadobacter psychrotolerans]TDE18126.1 hypothetical protein E0F88_00835 [Dyadobacter psychrotolerans]